MATGLRDISCALQVRGHGVSQADCGSDASCRYTHNESFRRPGGPA